MGLLSCVADPLWGFQYAEKALQTLVALSELISEKAPVRVVFLSDRDELKKAEFDGWWSSIRLFPNLISKDYREIEMSLLHELFHAVAFYNPDLYSEFVVRSPWTVEGGQFVFQDELGGLHYFEKDEVRYNHASIAKRLGSSIYPSLYSLSGPEEHFAEAGLAAYVLLARATNEYSVQRFPSLGSFPQVLDVGLFSEVFICSVQFISTKLKWHELTKVHGFLYALRVGHMNCGVFI